MFENTMEWMDSGWDQEDFHSPWDDSGDLVFGDLSPDSVWELQDTPFTCAVVSQQMILREFGIDISESQLVYHATANGWPRNIFSVKVDRLDFEGVEVWC